MSPLENPSKPWWRSATLISLAVSAGAQIAAANGVNVPVEVQGMAVDLVGQGVAMAALAGAAWGRLRANQPIGR